MPKTNLNPGHRVPKSTGTLTGVLQSRRVPLRGPLTERSAACCINRMLILAADHKRLPIIIDVESPEGSLRHALAIIRTINGISCPVATFCRGNIGGPSLLIAAHGVRGYRVSHPSTQFHVPGAWRNASHKQEGWHDDVPWHSVLQLLGQDTARSEELVLGWLGNGSSFGPDQALKIGLIDVLDPKPVFPEAATVG